MRMFSQFAAAASDADPGCAFILEGGADASEPGVCQARRRPGSAYCPAHHALCHLPSGSAAERWQLREIEALAAAVGGRQGRPARTPPPALLRRLERLERAFLRAECSRIVRPISEEETMPGKQSGKVSVAAERPERDGGPTAERRRHGSVERVERAIADADGHPARPYRALDTLMVMERRGSITAGMRQAGEDFRTRFQVAQLDPLRATDFAHLRFDGERRHDREAPGMRIERARRAVWLAIQAVGGIASPAGSCLWHVLGWQCTLKEWAMEQGWAGRQVSQEAASGILVAALGALEAHLQMPHRVS
jgi:hypothetical protein